MKLCVTCLFFVILISCNRAGKKGVRKVDEGLKMGLPKNVVTDGAIQIGVYDFEGLEPLLNRKNGKTYVVNFWATWCKPCVAELPYFERLGEKYKDSGVEVVLVSLDMPGTLDKKLLPFVKREALTSRVVVLDDPRQNDWIPKVAEEWSGAIPATLIYNKDRRAFYESSLTYTELEENLNALTDTK